MVFQREIDKIKEKLTNVALYATFFFMLPAFVGSIIRYFELGWHNIYLIHILLVLSMLVLIIRLKYLSVKSKLNALTIILSIIVVGGMLSFTLVGGWFLIFAAITILTLVQGRKYGVIYFVGYTIFYVLVAILNHFNIIAKIDYNTYIKNTTTWLTLYIATLFACFIIIYVSGLFYKLFNQYILELSSKSKELDKTLTTLKASEERFRIFMNRYPYPITIKDSKLNFIYVNEAVGKITNFKGDLSVVSNSSDIFTKEISEQLHNIDKEVLETNKYIVRDVNAVLGGGRRHYRLIKFPLKDSNSKKLVGTISINTTEQKAAEEMLLMSEKKYRTLFEGGIDGFVFTDNKGIILECNSSFATMLGYSKNEIITKSFLELTPEEYHENELKLLTNGFSIEQNYSGLFEKEYIHKSGKRIPVEINVYKVELNKDIYFGSIVNDLTEKKQYEQKLYKAMVESEEKERERYAKELHDGLGPILSTCMIYINAIRNAEDKKDQVTYSDRSIELLNDAVSSIREISNNLSPVVLKNYGLTEALKAFVAKLQDLSNTKVEVNSNMNASMTELVAFTLYRTLIELINNSIKHAEASLITIDLNMGNAKLVICYTDNGKGFDYEAMKTQGKGFGLLNLESRIQKIGGKYDFRSKIGKGVDVIIMLDSDKL